jgi:hypothetical protein
LCSNKTELNWIADTPKKVQKAERTKLELEVRLYLISVVNQ